MAETRGQTSGATTRSARPEFFHVGGPIPADRPGYVRRGVDDRVDDALAAGCWVNLGGPPGSGKTSLLLRQADGLREQGTYVALIDFAQIAQRDGGEDAARWFYAVAFRLARQLRGGFDLQSWWSENALLAPPQRLLELLREIVQASPGKRFVLMFDDVDMLASLPLGELFLQGLRLAWDARTTDPEMLRLQVVLAGTGVTQFGAADAASLPWGIAAAVDAAPFTLAETLRLGPALGLPRATAELAMQRIHDWVAGHPALTQCLARGLARDGAETAIVAAIDRIARSRLESGRDRNAQALLNAMASCLLDARRPVRDQLLVTLGRVSKGQRVLLDPRSEAHDRLLRAGVLTVSPDGYLLCASRISRRYFSAGWANSRMRLRYLGLVKAAALLLVFIALPAWYRLQLPQPHVAAMTDPAASPAAVLEASERLARWPGYGATAQRIATDVLARRARNARDPGALAAATAPLEGALNAADAATAARRAFWQRAMTRAERAGDRPGAILAGIAAIANGDDGLRQRLAGLLGSDLPELRGVVATGGPFDVLRFRPRDGRFVTRSATTLATWPRPVADAVQDPVQTLSPTALSAQPTVLRFELGARRRGAPPRLSFAVTHPRPGDLEVTVTTPTGATVTRPIDARATDGPRIEVALDGPAGLETAVPAGGWTVAFADVRPGVRGGVADVALGDATPIDAAPSVGLADPQPVTADRVAVTGDADHALAWPSAEGNRAVVWDLRAGEIAASFPVTPGTRLLGFVNGDREALLIDGVTLVTRRLDDGAPVLRERLQRPVSTAWASGNGRWLAAQEAERDARLFVIDLVEDTLVATIGAGVAHERVRVSDDGRFVAAADADRTLRVWRIGARTPPATLQIEAPVRSLDFTPTASHVLARLAGGGMLAWRSAGDTPPERWGGGAQWSVVDDPQSGLSLIGSPRDGFRVHDFAERRDRSLPLLGAGEGSAAVLRVRDNLAVVAAPGQGLATLWRPRLEALPTGANRIQRAWLSNDGRAIAFADARDAFTVLRLDAGVPELASLDTGVTTVAHASTPGIVRTSPDARYALSIEASGLFRVRDVAEGAFFDFIGRAGADVVDAHFSHDGERFLLLRRQSLEVYATATGRLLSREYRDVPLVAAAPHGAGWIVGDADGRLYAQPPTDDGVPLGLAPLRVDIPAETRLLASAQRRWLVAAGDASLQLVDLVTGRATGGAVTMPGPVREMRFSADGRHVVVRSGHWLLRLRAGAFGLARVDVRLLPPDMLGHNGFALADATGSGVTLLRGLDEPVPDTVWFDYRDVAPATGAPDALYARWRLLAPLVRSVPVPVLE